VGLYPDAAFEVGSVQLEPEDVLLAYTDGVIDAQNKNGETFSRHRLNKLLAEPCPSAKALIDAISLKIKTHISNQDQFDDITILALRRKKS
jgi:serine phosphatase RsbU (regulator of sigma subunit)